MHLKGAFLVRKNLEVCLLIDYYGKTLTEKQYNAIDLYYNEDLSLAEIAEHTGITRQGVRDAIENAKASLYSLEEALGYVKKSQAVQESARKITAAANRLDEINSNSFFSSEISEIINTLKDAIVPLVEFSSEDDDDI